MRVAVYIVRRIVLAIPQLLVITVGVFLLLRAVPADPVARLVGYFPSEANIRLAREQMGLDKSIPEQLWLFLTGVVHGDLGKSWVTSRPITSEIRQFFPITLELLLISLAVALAIAIPAGMLSALRPQGLMSRVVFVWGLFAGSQPPFWWALVFALVFYYKAGWAPAPLGRVSVAITAPPTVTGMLTVDSILAGNWAVLKSALYHMALPVVTNVFIMTGAYIKHTRESMVRVLTSDFILFARASGVKAMTVARYALRNALPPVVTMVGVLFGWNITGLILIEEVFSWGGFGQYAIRSVLMFDYPAIQGTVIAVTAWSLAVYIVLDILYVLIDPRIRL